MKTLIFVLFTIMSLPHSVFANFNKVSVEQIVWTNPSCDTILMKCGRIIIANIIEQNLRELTLKYCHEEKTSIVKLINVQEIYGKSKFEDKKVITTRKNAIYISIHSLVYYLGANLNYEKTLQTREKGLIKIISVKLGAGQLGSLFDQTITFVHSGVHALTGKKNNHLDASIGVTFFSYQHSSSKFLPAGSIAYRFQKPMGHFVFRTGVGFPEGVFVSLGAAF